MIHEKEWQKKTSVSATLFELWIFQQNVTENFSASFQENQVQADKLYISRIWVSHGGEYEDGCLLGCSAV
jgi:hypothetical protein